jgi:hypothetical protein
MNLDTKTLIHVGTELVVVGGLAFWMNKKIGLVESKMDALLQQLAVYEDAIQKQQKMINTHEAAFRQIFGGHKPQGLPSPPEQDQPSNEHKPPTMSPPTSPPVSNTASLSSTQNKKKKEKPDVPADILDKILQKELSRETEVLEIPTDESEYLKPSDSKKKRLNRKNRKNAENRT